MLMLLATVGTLVLADGQFSIPVFENSVPGVGHWAAENDVHEYGHHDHHEFHDHPHEEEIGPHQHYVAEDDGVELHECWADGKTAEEADCVCQQENGLFRKICEAGQVCDPMSGRCQHTSCFDTCRRDFPRQDEDQDARNTCYNSKCLCDTSGEATEAAKCALPCADCGPVQFKWSTSGAEKREATESLFNDIFGSGLMTVRDWSLLGYLPWAKSPDAYIYEN